MARNTDDLVQRVVGRLAMTRPGEDPDEDVAAAIRAQWPEIHAELVSDQIAYWPVDAIPLQVFKNIVTLVALEVAPDFGAMPVILNAIGTNDAEVAKDGIKRKLREHVAKDFNEERMQVIPY